MVRLEKKGWWQCVDLWKDTTKDEREWSGREWSSESGVEWSEVFFRLMLINLKIKYGVLKY